MKSFFKNYFSALIAVIGSLILTVPSFAGECCEKEACTSFVAGPLATTDGSAMSGHTCDGNCDFRLKVIPAAKHEPGEMYIIDYPGIPGGFQHDVVGEIPQVRKTNKYFFIECSIGNEYQVFFGENTCSSKSELETVNREEALLDWSQVPALALQRGKTARQAIRRVGKLIEQYGLAGGAESLLVTDPYEAWLLEIPGYSNLWIAQRIPDDHVCPHANRLRIGEVDPKNKNLFMGTIHKIIKNAKDKGFYNPKTDGPFNFEKVYSNESSRNSFGNRRREWRMFSLLAPSQNWDPDAITYPLSIKPDMKISPKWWINNIHRDHYEGTPYDLTKGIPAGPFGCPERASISGVSSERAIGIPRTSYAWVSQSRKWLPDPIGGVIWLGLDAAHSSCYVPFYTGVTEIPESWQSGDFIEFSDTSARWSFQVLDNYSCIRFNEMNAEIRENLDAIEEEQFDKQAEIEAEALALFNFNREQFDNFITEYSTTCALRAEIEAKELFYDLVAKYADGRPRTTVSEEWVDILNEYQPQ